MSDLVKFVHIVSAEAPEGVALDSNGSNMAIRYFDNIEAANDAIITWAHKGLKVLYTCAPVFSNFDSSTERD